MLPYIMMIVGMILAGIIIMAFLALYYACVLACEAFILFLHTRIRIYPIKQRLNQLYGVGNALILFKNLTELMD